MCNMSEKSRSCCDSRTRWITGLAILSIAVILTTAATVLVTGHCRGHIFCENEDISVKAVYWAVVCSSLVCFVILLATLLRVLRLDKKWRERSQRLRTEFEVRNFESENIYNSSDFSSHLFNPNLNRISHLFPEQQSDIVVEQPDQQRTNTWRSQPVQSNVN